MAKNANQIENNILKQMPLNVRTTLNNLGME